MEKASIQLHLARGNVRAKTEKSPASTRSVATGRRVVAMMMGEELAFQLVRDEGKNKLNQLHVYA